MIPNKTPANGDVPITVEATTMLTSHNCRSNNNADDGSQEEDNVNNRDKNKATTNSDTKNFDGGLEGRRHYWNKTEGKQLEKSMLFQTSNKKRRQRNQEFVPLISMTSSSWYKLLLQKMRPQRGRMTTEAQNWLQILTMRLRQHTMTITAQDCRQILMLRQRPFALART